MEEETVESVYDIGYGYRNPCRYLQEVLIGVLRCLGLERSGGGGGDSTSSEEGGGGGGEGGIGGGDGGDGGGEMDDPLTTPPSSDPLPIDEPAPATVLARRTPPKGPISSGGGGQTN
ncbi:hypothetical protein L2E82_47293 [Cichorium intybus]|uniref:Uncharacterized protein n=1 Tax=Cichorium intybus TaxID=13427 RepID=A0ACB8YUC1_CICIN|nr:hypothetical protein L2E82_47293 [Cichorium intybus]